MRRSAGESFVSIGNPDIGHSRRAQFLPEVFADLAAGNAVLHPKLADAFILMGKREPICGFGMREAGRVEIDPVVVRLRPILPTRKVARLDFVAFHFLIGFEIDGMEVQAVRAGQQAVDQVKVAAQFIRVAGFAGIISRCGNAAAQVRRQGFRIRPHHRPASSAG